MTAGTIPANLPWFTQCCCSLDNDQSEPTLSLGNCAPAMTENDFLRLDQVNWPDYWAEGSGWREGGTDGPLAIEKGKRLTSALLLGGQLRRRTTAEWRVKGTQKRADLRRGQKNRLCTK